MPPATGVREPRLGSGKVAAPGQAASGQAASGQAASPKASFPRAGPISKQFDCVR